MSEQLPLFVYGTLRRGEAASELLEGVIVSRDQGRAIGRNIAINREFPAVRFSAEGREIVGDLLWIDGDAYEETLSRLDSYEGVPDPFHRVEIDVRVGTATHRAFAYQWADTQAIVGNYLFAVRRKIDIANFHLEKLSTESKDEPITGEHPSIAVQAHFEGILLAAASISDQLAEAINLALGFDLVDPNLEHVMPLLKERAVGAAGVVRWHNARISADLRELRRLVSHHWSNKTPRGPMIEVQQVMKGSYGGSRELLAYAEAVVSHVNGLPDVMAKLEEDLLALP